MASRESSKESSNTKEDMSEDTLKNKLTPDPELLESLVQQGIDKKLSRKALISTNNKSIEAAVKWISELGAEEMEALSGQNDSCSDSNSDWEDCDDEIEFKMVFLVNTELGMGIGKIASQVGHAAIGLYKVLKEDIEKYGNSLEEWEESGERKITLKIKNTQELLEVQKNAEKNDLPTYLVEDAGKTQIESGSVTVIGLFGDEDTVDKVTGHLKLI